jgi:Family of unknown function (DUF6267)
MRARQFLQLLTEAEQVGREYQHIEDLVYIYGPEGAIRALERLRALDKNSRDLEVKWDGSPAIYFGRDDAGRFHFGDKYHRTLNQSPEQLMQTYTKGADMASVPADRQQFIRNMVQLWPLYERATPANFRGYLEGGLLFSKLAPEGDKLHPDKEGNEWVFQPNTVIYHVNDQSNLGRRINQAVSAAAATGYFRAPPGMGGQREAVGSHANGFGSREVIIIPRKTSEVQVKVNDARLTQLERFIQQSASRIEQFITPSPEWTATYRSPEEATRAWRALIYNYVNTQVDDPQGLDRLGQNMAQWAATQASTSVLSKGRVPLAVAKIKQDVGGMRATFLAVRAIMHFKDDIINQVENKTLGSMGIRAEIPADGSRVAGGEGFVDDPAGGTQPLKFVKRGVFTRANRAKGRPVSARSDELAGKAKDALQEAAPAGKTAVVGWGRGMGHKGHMLLAQAVIHQAEKMNAIPIMILSTTSVIDPATGDIWADSKKVRKTKDDPLTTQEKMAVYRKTFPDKAKIFTTAGNLNDALATLAKKGIANVVLVVGEQEKPAFQYLVNPGSDGTIPYQNMGLQRMHVMSRQETGAPGSDIEGPRATPLRQVLLDPNTTEQEQFAAWRDGMPASLSDQEVLRLMRLARDRLRRAELIAPPGPKRKRVKEADNPDYFGGSSQSAIPGTPPDLMPHPDEEEIRAHNIEMARMRRWMGHDSNW